MSLESANISIHNNQLMLLLQINVSSALPIISICVVLTRKDAFLFMAFNLQKCKMNMLKKSPKMERQMKKVLIYMQ